MNTKKIAITIPKDLLSLIDELGRSQGISRSRMISDMLRARVDDEKKQCLKKAYDRVFSDDSVRREQLELLIGTGPIKASKVKG